MEVQQWSAEQNTLNMHTAWVLCYDTRWLLVDVRYTNNMHVEMRVNFFFLCLSSSLRDFRDRWAAELSFLYRPTNTVIICCVGIQRSVLCLPNPKNSEISKRMMPFVACAKYSSNTFYAFSPNSWIVDTIYRYRFRVRPAHDTLRQFYDPNNRWWSERDGSFVK